jgi:hypothetical protein
VENLAKYEMSKRAQAYEILDRALVEKSRNIRRERERRYMKSTTARTGRKIKKYRKRKSAQVHEIHNRALTETSGNIRCERELRYMKSTSAHW